MAKWINRSLVQTPRNGTTSHTVTFTAATSGNLLVCVAYGAVTSTTPTGWTLPTGGSAVNNGGLYVWHKTATAGESSFATTHNSSNYPLAFAIYEFAAGSTFVKAVAQTSVAPAAASPNLTGLTGTNLLVAALGQVANTALSGSIAWSGATEDVDQFVATGGLTNGYLFGDAYVEDSTAASFAPTPTVTGGSATNTERVSFAVTVAATGRSGTGAGSWSFAGTGSGKRTPKATGAGSWTFAGSGGGDRQPKASGSGSWAFAGSGTGQATRSGAGTGTTAWTGSGSGTRPAGGSGAGSWSFVGDGTGATVRQGAGSGTAVWTGTGSGTAPPVGVNDGSGSGSGAWSFTGAGSGTRTSSGSGTGLVTWTGSGTGTAPETGGGGPDTFHPHTYVTATLAAGSGLAILGSNGSSTATLAGAGLSEAVLAASLSVAGLTGHLSTATLTDDAALATLQTTT